MSVRLLTAAVLLVALAAGCGSGSRNGTISNHQVRAAFARQGLLLHSVFIPGGSKNPSDDPNTFFNVGGHAGAGERPPAVDVYSSHADAVSAAKYSRPSGGTILVAKNVVYYGPPSAAARRAVQSLRKK